MTFFKILFFILKVPAARVFTSCHLFATTPVISAPALLILSMNILLDDLLITFFHNIINYFHKSYVLFIVLF